ncbi:GNAT family N-acetyltransferase [Kitasatospora sp. NPDC048540]|uniref:GNAT family N-acetyltransferase n=1 Tax=Kitasatospora sp. NPDC048540 TaxID=3155634 RepID=UPI0033D47B43
MIDAPPAQAAFDIEIRPIGEHEITTWDRALMRGFLSPHEGDGTEVRHRQFVPGRWLAAVDHTAGGAFVGTYRSYDLELALPGGAAVPVHGITGVSVAATHRRRGLLSRMLNGDLAAARERGSVAAVLIAAEYPIYGRFGFGPATRMAGLTVDVPRSGGLRSGLRTPAGGRIDFATPEEVRKLGPELYDRWRLTQPGALSRPAANWAMDTGEVVLPARGWKEPFFAVHRDAAGVVTGLAVYRVDDKWIGMAPDSTLKVMDFLALDRPTANALWRLLFAVDWVQRIEVEDIGPDDPLPLLLANPRAATPHVSQTDFTWLRLLNLPAAFAVRRYAGPGRMVLAVTDPHGWTSGNWLLETASDGTGRCTPTELPTDLTLGVSELSTLYLGTEAASRLLAAGLLAEDTPGAAARLDHLLHTPMRAWNTLTI